MHLKEIALLAAAVVTVILMLPAAALADAAAPTTSNVNELEKELTAIESELSGLEEEIDILLEDLVDPRITSFAIFFASQEIPGQVPAFLEIHLDGELLTSLRFSETDRLVLIRGGAIEVYSGITDPVRHDIVVECTLTSREAQNGLSSTGKSTFRFDAIRARANYLEISLIRDEETKPPSIKLSSRFWYKEP